MRLKLLVGLAFLPLFLMSCELDEELAPTSVSSTAMSASNASVINSFDGQRQNLLIEGRFEPILEAIFDKQVSTSYGLTVSTALKRSGSKSVRFEMRKADDPIRSEIVLPGETESNRWYGTSIYLPSKDWERDGDPDGWDIITQWHAREDAGEKARFPPIALVVSKGHFFIVMYWATQAHNTNSTIDGKKAFDLGPIETDKWLDFVYHINFSHQADGILQVWKNGTQEVDFKGPNSYNDRLYPYFKAGIYKRKWNDISKRSLYLDDVRVGNDKATYLDVAPEGISNDDVDDDQPLRLLLMNAETQQPIQVLTDGVTLNLATLPTTKLSVQAAARSSVGSVDFKLSGVQKKNNLESTMPYSLFGDTEGKHEAWTPTKGNYSLTATSYSGENGSGTAGPPLKVHFEVVDEDVNINNTPRPKAAVVINNNARTTTSAQVTLVITASDATEMRFYDDDDDIGWSEWEPITATKPWTLSSGEGSKWVKIQVRNDVGKVSATAFDGIVLDRTGTPTVSMVINDDAAITQSTQVTLNIKATGAAEMRFYDDDDNIDWSEWEPIATTKPWTLSSGEGSKWVKIQVRSAAGKVSTSAFDGIHLK